MTMYLLYDDVEEFLVAAHDRNDVFKVIEEQSNADTADELVGSHLVEYPPDFVFGATGETAAAVAARGRGIACINVLRPGGGRIPKPPAKVPV